MTKYNDIHSNLLICSKIQAMDGSTCTIKVETTDHSIYPQVLITRNGQNMDLHYCIHAAHISANNFES